MTPSALALKRSLQALISLLMVSLATGAFSTSVSTVRLLIAAGLLTTSFGMPRSTAWINSLQKWLRNASRLAALISLVATLTVSARVDLIVLVFLSLTLQATNTAIISSNIFSHTPTPSTARLLPSIFASIWYLSVAPNLVLVLVCSVLIRRSKPALVPVLAMLLELPTRACPSRMSAIPEHTVKVGIALLAW